jgi:hypothetical protein
MYTLVLPRRTVLVRMRANGSRKRVVVKRGFNNRVDWATRS